MYKHKFYLSKGCPQFLFFFNPN
uniref:Uncharacterized protein n=1 Tax=Rhizophora mucronata TaxID=61149 RepID=A0A2P2M6C3_RHIMU